MKIVILYSQHTIYSWLTKFFTGSRAYHVGFWSEDTSYFYSTSLLFHRVRGTPDPVNHVVVPCPVQITDEDLENEIFDRVNELCEGDYLKSLYGFRDYLAFGLRKVYHLLGLSTPNFKGEICSETLVNIMVKKGWESPFEEVPSPADIAKYFNIPDPY